MLDGTSLLTGNDGHPHCLEQDPLHWSGLPSGFDSLEHQERFTWTSGWTGLGTSGLTSTDRYLKCMIGSYWNSMTSRYRHLKLHRVQTSTYQLTIFSLLRKISPRLWILDLPQFEKKKTDSGMCVWTSCLFLIVAPIMPCHNFWDAHIWRPLETFFFLFHY